MKSNFLGFTFWKSTKGWGCKPTDTAKKKLETKVKEVLLRKRAVAQPLYIVFTKLNQIVRGWVNYYHIGSMSTYLRDKCRQCGMFVFNFLLSPKVLAMPKENRTDKRKSRPGLVDPYALYQNLRTPICM